jgi:hypothetical protein
MSGITRVGDRVRVSCGHTARDPVTGLTSACPLLASHLIVHQAQLVTVLDNSAGEESIELGAPAADAVVLGVRVAPIAMDGSCRVHLDAQLARYQRLGLADLRVMTLKEASNAGVKVQA